MLTKPTIGYLSPEEYFALEAQSETRHEYYNGEIFAMAGTSQNHNTIALNMAFAFREQLKSKSCLLFIEQIKVELAVNTHYTYPDLVISCDPRDDNGKAHKINYPALVIEILSESTAEYDRGLKRQKYFKLDSLQYYILVSQDICMVEVYERINNTQIWQFCDYELPTDIVYLSKLGDLQISVAQIYENIVFENAVDDTSTQ